MMQAMMTNPQFMQMAMQRRAQLGQGSAGMPGMLPMGMPGGYPGMFPMFGGMNPMIPGQGTAGAQEGATPEQQQSAMNDAMSAGMNAGFLQAQRDRGVSPDQAQQNAQNSNTQSAMASVGQQLMENPQLMQQAMQFMQGMQGGAGMPGMPPTSAAPQSGTQGANVTLAAPPSGEAAAVAAASNPVIRARFAQQLEALIAMGFSDEQKCLQALVDTGGNVDRALDKLFSSQ